MSLEIDKTKRVQYVDKLGFSFVLRYNNLQNYNCSLYSRSFSRPMVPVRARARAWLCVCDCLEAPTEHVQGAALGV